MGVSASPVFGNAPKQTVGSRPTTLTEVMARSLHIQDVLERLVKVKRSGQLISVASEVGCSVGVAFAEPDWNTDS